MTRGAHLGLAARFMIADELATFAGGSGIVDLPCPSCGPDRRSEANQRRKVLRIWRGSGEFVTWHCVRCGESGYRLADHHRPKDRAAFAPAPREIAAQHAEERQAGPDKALWLWRLRRPIRGTIAEVYLREARGCSGALPATLGFLPERGDHPPSLIAAFGIPDEPEPGVLAMPRGNVAGVHLTRLLPDGSGKAGEPAKIIVGRCMGLPIVLAPMNDLLGLAIVEGIEDALSIHAATGLGAWAAGSATRMPALAGAVPDYTDFITIVADDDAAGRKGALGLAKGLEGRGLSCCIRTFGITK